ncbi:MAG: S-layer homology domain-containing protein [Clostridia bacterium]|nr:S-layer homology domain-containing protein [Clostridia bacterium]
MRKKRILSTVLAVLLLCVQSFSAFAYEPSYWATDAVEGAMKFSIISEQFSQKSYQGSISRGDFINVAVNLYATITAENVSTHANNPFTDTTDPFPNMAYYAGIVSGDGEGHFNPQGTLTRQELCKIITSLLDSAGVLGPYFPSENVFENVTDADQIASWAKNHVAFMMDNNLMAGDDEGTFRPNDPVTREEAAIIAYRCFVRYGKDFDGQIKTALRQTRDAKGNTIQTLVKTIVLPSGATVALANADNPNAPNNSQASTGTQTAGLAPSGTPLQTLGADGLYRLKTYSETLASGEAAEKEARIFPSGNKFTSAEEANAKMSEVTVNVWKVDDAGKYYTSTLTFKIHEALKADVIAIFDEIYNSPVKAPLKDVNAYSWRNAMSSGTYSDHNYGVAIDLNYNENYCVYASGTVVGSFYDPGNSIYSFPSDGVVVQTFAKYGWLWGGNAWVNGTVDYMHFSYLGK